MIKTASLEDIIDIRYGWYGQPSAKGLAAYLQVRQFNQQGRQIHEPTDFIDLDKNTKSHVKWGCPFCRKR
jgi:hypothetical protein